MFRALSFREAFQQKIPLPHPLIITQRIITQRTLIITLRQAAYIEVTGRPNTAGTSDTKDTQRKHDSMNLEACA